MPALLHTCRLSRTYALKHWFQYSSPNTTSTSTPGLTYFINFKRDAILFDTTGRDGSATSYSLSLLIELVRSNCRNHVPGIALRHAHNDAPSFETLLWKFPSLEELIIMSPEAETKPHQTSNGLDNLEVDEEAVFDWQGRYTVDEVMFLAHTRYARAVRRLNSGSVEVS